MDASTTIIYTAGVTVGIMTFAYLLSLKLRDASIVDIFWGLGFLVLARVLLIAADPPTTTQLIVAAMTTLWGGRLALHILMRKLDEPKEDWRYTQWRKDWGKKFWWQSYYRIFLLQALLTCIVAAPIWLSAWQPDRDSLHTVQIIGMVIWAIGFLFEAVGDYQLSRFLKDKKAGKTKKKIMTSGVWALTRHPNYFGEVSMWWGLFLIVVVGENGWIGIISPLLITYLLLKVSGIPMLEKKYDRNKEFQAYKKKTPAFFPKLKI